MKLHLAIKAVLIGLSFSVLATPQAKASSFSFTKIAEVTGPSAPDSFIYAAINNKGEVAFEDYYGSGKGSAIRTGNGGLLSTYADSHNPVFSGDLFTPSINDAGTVAYESIGSSTLIKSGIYTGSTGHLIAKGDDLSLAPSLNNQGQVVFTNNLVKASWSVPQDRASA